MLESGPPFRLLPCGAGARVPLAGRHGLHVACPVATPLSRLRDETSPPHVQRIMRAPGDSSAPHPQHACNGACRNFVSRDVTAGPPMVVARRLPARVASARAPLRRLDRGGGAAPVDAPLRRRVRRRRGAVFGSAKDDGGGNLQYPTEWNPARTERCGGRAVAGNGGAQPSASTSGSSSGSSSNIGLNSRHNSSTRRRSSRTRPSSSLLSCK